MKKVTAIILALLLLAPFAACQSRDKKPSSQSASESVDDTASSSKDELGTVDDSSEPSEESSTVDTEAAEKAANELLSALQSGKRDSIQALADYRNLLGLAENDPAETDILVLLQYMQYDVLSTVPEGEDAIVSVQLTNIDMNAAMKAYLKDAMDLEYNNALSDAPLSSEELENQYHKLFSDTLEKNKASTIQLTVEMKMLDMSGTWKVQASDTLRDGILGNYYASLQQTGENAGGGNL